MSRPVVTGLGAAGPAGTGASALWARLLEAAPLLATPPAREGGPAPAGAAAVGTEDFPAERYTDRRAVRKASELARLGAAAAHLCLDDASFPDDPALREATGVIVATTFGSSRYYLDLHEAIRRRGLKAANAVLFTESVFNAASGHVSAIHRLHGPSLTFAGGEEAGISTLAAAADRVRLGACRAVLAGGAEQYSDLVHHSLLAQGHVGAAAPSLDGPPAPLAEGAAALLVEDAASAAARGAAAYAEVLGSGRARAGAGAEDALERAARRALEDAGLEASEVDLVVGGAAGATTAAREREALARLFPPGATAAYAAPKTVLGEGFAWTSAALPLVAAAALVTGVVPPTRGPAAGWPLALGAAPVERPLRRALVLAASAPGGAAAVVLAAPGEGLGRRELPRDA